MANRSYLYATDLLPAPGIRPAEGRIIGISEWAYDIPLAFKLLLTGKPRKSISSIWKAPDEIAIVGEFGSGAARLFRELNRIADPRIADLRSESKAFLTAPENRRNYFVLECGEIYELKDEPLSRQNDRLWNEINRLSGLEAVEWPRKIAKRGLVRTAPGTSEKDGPGQIDIESLGLGNWSNILYYDFTSDD